MGRSYEAIVFIGYKIKKEKLMKQEEIKKVIKKFCLCKENNEQNKFCPECGNQNIRVITEIKEIKYLSEYSQYIPYENYDHNNKYVYIVINRVKGATYDNEPVNSGKKELTVAENTKMKFMKEVNEIEPWNEDNYGLYTFVECN